MSKNKSKVELLEIIRTTKPTHIDHIEAEVDLENNRWWRDFWTKGIVAWIALALAAISLIWQIWKEL